MSSAQKFADFKGLPVGARRREAVRKYLSLRRGLCKRVGERAGVSPTMISKVLHGAAVSSPVEQAIEAEEQYESHEQVA